MAWRSAQPVDETAATRFQQEVFSIATLDQAGDLHIVGCAAIISSHERQAICLTAAHIFKGIYDLQSPKKHGGPNLPVFEDEKPFDLTPWLDGKKVKAVCVIDGVGHLCDVTSLCMLPPLDTALIVVEGPKDDSVTFGGVLGVNSDPLPVGTETILVSYKTQRATRIDEHTVRWDRGMAIRIGQVIAVENSGSGLIRAPVYIMSMPADSGMSGAPVFIYDPTMKGPKQVCGIISSDMSIPEAFEDTSIDGHLVASLVWSSAALNVRGPSRELITLKDLAERGAVKDYGAALRSALVETFEDGKWRVTLGTS